GECALDLGRCDRDRLERADDIGEPQAHEFHASLFDRAQYEVPLLVHRVLSVLLSPDYRPASGSSSADTTLDALLPQSSSRASSSAHARERAAMTSGARAASSAVSNGPARSTDGDSNPRSTC